MSTAVASCFISYNHADKGLAQAVRDGLDALGYRVWIDQGELRVGDSLVTAISEAIDRVDFLIALVSEHSVASNWCQKEVSLAMTGEIGGQGITVLPCRVGSVDMPPSLADKLYLSVTSDDPSTAVESLHDSMRKHLAPTEELPPRRRTKQVSAAPLSPPPRTDRYSPMTDVRMTGIDTNSMTSPRNDGTAGSALYRVPITLSTSPDHVWGELLVHHWNSPSQWTSMHRPGIASVAGSRILLDGTTIEEVDRYHLDTLKLAVAAANADRRKMAEREQAQREREAEQRRAHRAAAEDAASRIKFD